MFVRALCHPVYIRVNIDGPFFLSLPISPFPSSLALSLLPLPFALRSRIEINDTLGASAKRDHENRFERSRRKLLDGRLNRPMGSWLANVQPAIAHVQNKYVPRTSS